MVKSHDHIPYPKIIYCVNTVSIALYVIGKHFIFALNVFQVFFDDPNEGHGTNVPCLKVRKVKRSGKCPFGLKTHLCDSPLFQKQTPGLPLFISIYKLVLKGWL